MSKSFGLAQTETRNLSFKNESLCLIGGRPARTSTDSTCVDLIRPKQIRPALHCIRSSLLIWQSDLPEKLTPQYSITDRTFLILIFDKNVAIIENVASWRGKEAIISCDIIKIRELNPNEIRHFFFYFEP
jgi:hypothetical protein